MDGPLGAQNERHVRIKASSMYPELLDRLKSQCMIYVRIIRGPYMCPVGGPVEAPQKWDMRDARKNRAISEMPI